MKHLILRAKKFILEPTNAQTMALWVSAITAALIAVIYARLFRLAESAFHALLRNDSWWAMLLTPVGFWLSWYLVYRFAPGAVGSGIPQILAASEFEGRREASRTGRLLSLRVAAVKIVSSLVCLVSGGAIGREGPTLQVSASLFYVIARNMKKYIGEVNEQTWIVAGSAAGLASAFNTPLGGIVYAIEELSIAHFHRVRTALFTAVIVSGLMAQWLLGSYLYLGYPQLHSIGFEFLPAAVLAGLITGFCGACFGKALFLALQRKRKIADPRWLGAFAVACGFVVAGLAQWDPRISGPGIDLVSGYLFNSDRADLILPLVRAVGTALSYLCGAAGGIFSPSLAMGGAIGSYLTGFFGSGHAHLMVLLGMIGFLTGVVRTPFTSFILVLEMTDRHSAIFPMMITALVAQGVAGLIDEKSFYENVKGNFLVPSAA